MKTKPPLPNDTVRCDTCHAEPLERCWDEFEDRPYLQGGHTAYHPKRIAAAAQAEEDRQAATMTPERGLIEG